MFMNGVLQNQKCSFYEMSHSSIVHQNLVSSPALEKCVISRKNKRASGLVYHLSSSFGLSVLAHCHVRVRFDGRPSFFACPIASVNC